MFHLRSSQSWSWAKNKNHMIDGHYETSLIVTVHIISFQNDTFWPNLIVRKQGRQVFPTILYLKLHFLFVWKASAKSTPRETVRRNEDRMRVWLANSKCKANYLQSTSNIQVSRTSLHGIHSAVSIIINFQFGESEQSCSTKQSVKLIIPQRNKEYRTSESSEHRIISLPNWKYSWTDMQLLKLRKINQT